MAKRLGGQVADQRRSPPDRGEHAKLADLVTKAKACALVSIGEISES
jgi:hypothetical protein